MKLKLPRVGAALIAGAFAAGAVGVALAGAPTYPAWEHSTAQSPPWSKRISGKQGFSGTWERAQRLPEGVSLPAGFTPPGQIPRPPFKPEHAAAYEEAIKVARENERKGTPNAITIGCLPEGMPGMMNAIFPMEIFDTPGQITIVQESYNQVRRIYLDEPQGKMGDVEPTFYGHSAAHWEGDTLIVDTIGVKESARFRQGGNPHYPHSMEMRIVERIKLLTPDLIIDEVTVTDPVYLTGPWKWTYLYRRSPGYKIQEYVCEENRASFDSEGRTTVTFTEEQLKRNQ